MASDHRPSEERETGTHASSRRSVRSTLPRRVVLLGASNLTRGISTVVETAQAVWGSPLEVLAALGHGRSYGLRSRVLGRELPGITSCGLWGDLAARGPAETAALVTDIGNDLLYGASVPTILGWVAESLDRLMPLGARTVMTLLPLASVETLSQWRFKIARTCAFPKSRAQFDEILHQARELNAGLARLAAERNVRIVEQRGAWYGFDAIHIRLRHRRAAWSEILAPWSDAPSAAPTARGSLTRWLYLRSLPPLERRLFGRARRAAQPSGRLRDGTTIALY
jgi:hypothetical protein